MDGLAQGHLDAFAPAGKHRKEDQNITKHTKKNNKSFVAGKLLVCLFISRGASEVRASGFPNEDTAHHTLFVSSALFRMLLQGSERSCVPLWDRALGTSGDIVSLPLKLFV